MQKQFMITIGGLSGNGKSTLAEKLQGDFNNSSAKVVVLDSDYLRKSLWYKEQNIEEFDPKAVLPVEAYSSAFSEKAYQSLLRKCDEMLKQGYSLIVDATFLDEKNRNQIESLARDNGVRFNGVWLENEISVLKQRADHREKGVSDANAFVVGLQSEKNTGTLDGWLKVRTDDTIQATYDAVRKGLKL